jgi:uncharacterized membrane protein HdeD (DUF308 family)
MKNRKHWLILKGILLLLAAILVMLQPDKSTNKKWIGFLLIAVWTITFIRDLIEYKKQND